MDGRRSVERIAEVLRGIRAEVVCLQEVHQRLPFGGLQNQPDRLRRLLGGAVVFQNLWRGGAGGYGNAILTALPIRSRASHWLPNEAEHRRHLLLRTEWRGLLEVVVETVAGALAVLTTHWSLEAEDRLRSAEWVAERVRSLPIPVILAGDFNAGADSAEMKRLREWTGLLDAGAERAEPTFPADDPHLRIDYVLHSPGLRVSRLTVVDSQASDHRPLVIEWT